MPFIGHYYNVLLFIIGFLALGIHEPRHSSQTDPRALARAIIPQIRPLVTLFYLELSTRPSRRLQPARTPNCRGRFVTRYVRRPQSALGRKEGHAPSILHTGQAALVRTRGLLGTRLNPTPFLFHEILAISSKNDRGVLRSTTP